MRPGRVWLPVIVAVATLAGCEGEHGRARKVREAPPPVAPLPPPTDGPSCDEVAQHLGAQAGGVTTGSVEAAGGTVEVTMDVGVAVRDGIFAECRRTRWTAAQKACALTFRGSVLSQAAELRATCGLPAAP